MQVNTLLSPANLRSVQGLELLARRSVRTLLPGLNTSPRTGPGLEFSQYRTYQEGDDLRFLDWKLYARSDRFFIREAEKESQLTLRIILDASASMLHEDQGIQKIDYARYLIATLAWLARQQNDRIALHAWSGERLYQIAPGGSQRHFHRFLHQLLQIKCTGKFPATIAERGLEGAQPQNELQVFISDLYEHQAELQQAMHRLSQSRNELVIFHLLAANELELDFRGSVTLEDLETGHRLQLDRKAYQEQYQQKLQAYLQTIRRQVLDWRAMYELIKTNELPGQALRTFLQRRTRLL
ncbi:MAG: DUF58 domain-containing protein [Bacteroidota bacterium]